MSLEQPGATPTQEVPGGRGERGPITDCPAASSTAAPCVPGAGRRKALGPHRPRLSMRPNPGPLILTAACPQLALPAPRRTQTRIHQAGHDRQRLRCQSPGAGPEGESGQSELLLPCTTKVLPLRPHCHPHQLPLRGGRPHLADGSRVLFPDGELLHVQHLPHRGQGWRREVGVCAAPPALSGEPRSGVPMV